MTDYHGLSQIIIATIYENLQFFLPDISTSDRIVFNKIKIAQFDDFMDH